MFPFDWFDLMCDIDLPVEPEALAWPPTRTLRSRHVPAKPHPPDSGHRVIDWRGVQVPVVPTN